MNNFDEVIAALEAMTRLSRYLADNFAKSELLTDRQIVSCKVLLPAWTAAAEVQENDCVQHEGRVYRCRQAHTTQADWTPDVTPTLWAVIDVAHAGTAEDPIPAISGMDYIVGKFYFDPEDGRTYRCSREGMADGDVINLQYLPHELSGQYFVLVTEEES